jgi:hypothetical protein
MSYGLSPTNGYRLEFSVGEAGMPPTTLATEAMGRPDEF